MIDYDIDHMKALSEYEKGVCAYCKQVYCEIDKLEECFTAFYSKDGQK